MNNKVDNHIIIGPASHHHHQSFILSSSVIHHNIHKIYFINIINTHILCTPLTHIHIVTSLVHITNS